MRYLLTISGSVALNRYISDVQIQMILNALVGVASVYITTKFRNFAKIKKDDKRN